MTFVEGLVRVLLKATLYAGVLLGAIVLDMHYDSVMTANVCHDVTGREGTWDCGLGYRVIDPMDATGRAGSALGQLP